MKRILINASNLHTGGGVQVAASFIFELSKLLDRIPTCELFVYSSTVVDTNLASAGFNKNAFKHYQVLDVHGIQALRQRVAEKFYGYDIVFTIFGPLYLPKYIPNHIVGFAQPWIIYPNNIVYDKLSLQTKILLRLKFIIQWSFFRKAHHLVAELEHVKNRLSVLKKFPAERVDVVSNCISSLYSDPSLWMPLPSKNDLPEDCIKLGYITRDYPHKNIDFLLEVGHELKRISNICYRFFVTLKDNEWNNHSPEFKKNIINIGPLNVAQCPTFYKSMDGVIFPSLLECFSATPLEAMAMARPLFASDRGFVRDCCGDNAIYFDPQDAKQAARKIDDWFSRTDEEDRSPHLDRAYRHVMSLPNSKDRARAYIDIINKQLLS